MKASSSQSTNSSCTLEVDLLLETGGGGSGRHVIDLYKGLRARGWDARLLLSARRADPNFKAELAQLPPEHLTFLDMHRSPHFSDLLVMARIRQRFLRSGRRHLLHAHSTKAGILGCALSRLDVKTVFTPHAYRGMDPLLKRPTAVALNRIEAAITSPYDRVIAVSPDEEAYIAALGIAEKRISYVPNGVDPIDIRTRVAQPRQHDAPVIGFVGRMVYQKNAALFLKAFRVLVDRGLDVRAMMIGDGPLRESLMQEAREANISHLIDWLGDVPSVEHLGRMDVVVHTSLYESLPYTLLEAAAASVPIVAVDNSGSRAVLGEHLPEAVLTGNNPAYLARAIVTLLGNATERRRHIAALQEVSRRFTVERMVDSTIDVYEAALAS